MHIEDIGGEQEPPTSSQLPSEVIERQTEKQIKITPVSTTANTPSSVSIKSNSTTSESETKVLELETLHDIDKDQPSTQTAAPQTTELHEDNPSSSRVNVSVQSEGVQTWMEVAKETEKDAGNGTAVAADVSDQGRQHNVVVPDVPDTSLQFQADWKRLRRDSNALTTYFKVYIL